MSKIALRLFSLLFCAVLLVACDSNDSSDEDFATGTMEADLDGTAWQATNANANRISAAGISTLTIAGATVDADALSLALVNVTEAGTYDLGSGNTGSFTRQGDFRSVFTSTSGTVTISSINDEEVEGTFSFEAQDTSGNTLSVTNGRFKAGFGVFGSAAAH